MGRNRKDIIRTRSTFRGTNPVHTHDRRRIIFRPGSLRVSTQGARMGCRREERIGCSHYHPDPGDCQLTIPVRKKMCEVLIGAQSSPASLTDNATHYLIMGCVIDSPSPHAHLSSAVNPGRAIFQETPPSFPLEAGDAFEIVRRLPTRVSKASAGGPGMFPTR